jgi:ABC-2 type transport system ATP-binding protein
MLGAMDDFAIHVRGLRKAYGTTVAVDGLDLDVRRGEVLAVLGPNGAGKTTTVEILEGFRRRTGGEVLVLGADPARATADWRRRIGVVLQSTGAFEDLTVAEVVGQFAAFFPDARAPDEVIAAVGLADRRNARAGTLSGGQRRRLDVAVGVVGRPELLFLDEPTTGFDPEARREFWHLIAGLRRGGTTVVLTTHSLEEAEALADRVAVVCAGRLVALGTPAELGGRATAAATVRWTDGSGRHEQLTATPATLVAELVARAGGEIPELTVTRPSLEDVYLELIGAHR